jgi:Htaa
MNRMPRRVSCAAITVLAALALALPAGASAALPAGPVSAADWDVRHSWVDYVTNPAWFGYAGQGTVTPTGSAASQAGYGLTGWSAPWTNYQYGTRFAAAGDSTAAGTRTVQLGGGIDFAMSVHSIDVRLSDVRVVKEPGGREHVVLDAYHDPLTGAPVTSNDVDFADLVDVPGTANQLQLTSDGATVFNGGSNGSYSAGDAFGRLVYNP